MPDAIVSNLLNRIEERGKDDLLAIAAPLTTEIYTFRAGNLRIFVSFGSDDDGDYVLLLDIAERAQAFSAPEKRQAVDDRRSSAGLDPRSNPSINPHLNPAINPRLNPELSPRFNPRVNPKLNPSLNPAINPALNSVLNPRLNWVINPRKNRAHGGPYVYDLDLNEEGFIIEATDEVSLIFDRSAEAIAVAVKNGIDGFTLFDLNNECVGQLIPDGSGGYLRFDDENEWIGIVR